MNINNHHMLEEIGLRSWGKFTFPISWPTPGLSQFSSLSLSLSHTHIYICNILDIFKVKILGNEAGNLLFNRWLRLTLCDPMVYSLPGSSAHGIFQARILERVAMPFSKGSSRLRDQTCVSCTGRWIVYHGATREAQAKIHISRLQRFKTGGLAVNIQ